ACARHPGERAVDVCSRCGNFLCLQCGLRLGAAPFCQPCLEIAQRDKTVKASVLPAWALTLSALSLLGVFTPVAPWVTVFGCLPLFAAAPVALGLGVVSLVRIRAGTIAPDEKR